MKKIIKHFIKKTIIIIYKTVKRISRTFKGLKLGQTKHRVSASEIVGKRAQVGTRHRTSKSSAPKQQSVISNNATRQGARKTVWWKNKRVIAAAVAGVAVVSLVMVFILPSKPDESQKSMSAALTNIKGTALDNQEESDPVEDNLPTNNTEKENQSVAAVAINQTDIDKQGASVDTETKTLPTPTPIATTPPEEQPLTPGCNDARIIDIQQRLMELGYMGMDEPTDYYGFVTEYSLQLFQRKHNLQVDGILGDETLEKLFDEEAMPYTVKLGDNGTDVKSIQERLQDLRYLSSKDTGYFGTDTEAAVKRFQERNDLHVDGNVGENTREVLYSEDAKAERTSSSSSGGSSSGGSSSGGGSSGPIAIGDPDEASADALVDYALTQLGKKYVRGGKGPNVFDCSGFVYYCLNKVGYKIGYMTSGGWAKSGLPKVTNMKDMKKGDIICFRGHVGIYMGNGKMVDASSSNGKIVTRSNIFNSSYWTRNFICARRVF